MSQYVYLLYMYSLHVYIFLCILLCFHSESKSNGCVDKTNLVQTGTDKRHVEYGDPDTCPGSTIAHTCVYECMHFEIEILVASLSLIQLALSTCKHFKSNASAVAK